MSDDTQKLRLTTRTTFTDRNRDLEFSGPGIFDVPVDAAEEYVETRPSHWEAVADSEADSGAESDADADGSFDAAGFVDGSWQTVVGGIEDGQADGHLDAVQQAEQNRDGDARDSVLDALDAARGE